MRGSKEGSKANASKLQKHLITEGMQGSQADVSNNSRSGVLGDDGRTDQSVLPSVTWDTDIASLSFATSVDSRHASRDVVVSMLRVFV